ncbi:MAG: o-succinylbenzoate synthase [Planctomycetes bacterium]|nr:o-succinylbenzoate synthase [Planctomycetota bacterium]
MSLRLYPYRLPFARPLRTARGVLRTRRGWLLEWPLPGYVGWGDACWWQGCGGSSRGVRRALADFAARADRLPSPAQAGSDPLDLEPWTRGLEGPARHAVACAALDLRAQVAGVPLARLLNPSARARCASHVLVGGAAEARAAAALGARAFKLKVGARRLAIDLQRVRELRDAVGPAATLRLDANGAWSRVEAAAVWPVLRELGVDFVEQPLPATDLAGLRALRGQGVGVAADESLAQCGVEAVLAAEAADVWILKPQALGGPDLAYLAGRRALQVGLQPVVTHALDSALGRRAAVHVACALGQDHPHGLGDPFAEDVARVAAGGPRATGPGLGVAPTHTRLRFPRTPVEVGS